MPAVSLPVPSVGSSVQPLTAVRCACQSISFGGISTADIDVTNLADTFKKYIEGTLDGGTLELQGMVVTAGPPSAGNPISTPQIIGFPVAGQNTSTAFTVFLGTRATSDAAYLREVPKIAFNGMLQGISIEAGIDAAISINYTVRLTSGVTVSGTTAGDVY